MKKIFSDFEKEKVEKAKELSKNGDLFGTLEVMKELVDFNPNSALFNGVLANTYWNLNQIENAILFYKKAILIAPEWELASLGLFHCLWTKDNKDEAFEEMKRFMAIADSNDYRNIVKEINS